MQNKKFQNPKVKHNCHYYKWNLNDDLSLRFFVSFQNRPEMTNTYQLKSHKKRIYQKINDAMAEELKSLCNSEPEEIIGRILNNGVYQKVTFIDGIYTGSIREN